MILGRCWSGIWKVCQLRFAFDLLPHFKRLSGTGQRSILESLLVFARDKEQVAIEIARTQGVELVFDGDSDEEDEFDEDSEDDDEGRLEDAAE